MPNAVSDETSKLLGCQLGLWQMSIQERRPTHHINHTIHRIPRPQSNRLFKPSIPHLGNCNESRSYQRQQSDPYPSRRREEKNPRIPASKAPKNILQTNNAGKSFEAVMQLNAIPQSTTVHARNFPSGTFTRIYATSGCTTS